MEENSDPAVRPRDVEGQAAKEEDVGGKKEEGEQHEGHAALAGSSKEMGHGR